MNDRGHMSVGFCVCSLVGDHIGVKTHLFIQCADCPLFLPSRLELLSALQVDLVVEIRSDSGEYQYVGPQLKVGSVPGAARVQPTTVYTRRWPRLLVAFGSSTRLRMTFHSRLVAGILWYKAIVFCP